MHTRVSGVFQETPTSPSAGLLGKPLQVIAGTIYLCSARVELGIRVRVECVLRTCNDAKVEGVGLPRVGPAVVAGR